MKVNIIQGNEHTLHPSDINIVIDVIRAFTVAHIAFINGVKEIKLVRTVEEALRLKQENERYLLAGEVDGLPIKHFDLDNSPYRINKLNLKDRIMVQKTTNGVKATLNALNANQVFVTGFSNARTTANYVKKIASHQDTVINVIASHPTGDDDLACAEYMKGIIEAKEFMKLDEVKRRITESHVTEKFFDSTKPEFNKKDIDFCLQERNTPFVMKLNQVRRIPTIERFNL